MSSVGPLAHRTTHTVTQDNTGAEALTMIAITNQYHSQNFDIKNGIVSAGWKFQVPTHRGKHNVDSSKHFSKNLSFSHESIFKLEDELHIQDSAKKPQNYGKNLPVNSNNNLPSLIHQELMSVLQRRRSDNDDTDEEEDVHDDEDEATNSPHETLSNFWANKNSDRFRPVNRNDRSRSDFISLQPYQHKNLVESSSNVTTRRGNLQLLSHNAAKHKIAVKPRRNYPQTRKKKVQPNDGSGQCEDSNFVATVNKLCGGGNGPLERNTFLVGSSDSSQVGVIQNCDTSKKFVRKKIKTENEKLSQFFQRFIGGKKHGAKLSNEKISIEQKYNKLSQSGESKQVVPIQRNRKKPPPPPPPTHNKTEAATVNVKTINHASGSDEKSNTRLKEEGTNFLPFPSLPTHNIQEQNVILKRNASLGCLLSLEESHEKFHSSIQNWSLANEGFVRSLVSFPDTIHQQPPSRGQDSLDSASHVSNESLISSLIGGDSMLDEPDYMEQTSLMVIHRTTAGSNNSIQHGHEAQTSDVLRAKEDKSEVSNIINKAINPHEDRKIDDNSSFNRFPLFGRGVKVNNGNYINQEFFENNENITMCHLYEEDDTSQTAGSINQRIMEVALNGAVERQSCSSQNIENNETPPSGDIEPAAADEDRIQQPADTMGNTHRHTPGPGTFAPRYQQEEVARLLQLADDDDGCHVSRVVPSHVSQDTSPPSRAVTREHSDQHGAGPTDHDTDYEMCNRKKAEQYVSKQIQPHELEIVPVKSSVITPAKTNVKVPTTSQEDAATPKPVPAPRNLFFKAPASDLDTELGELSVRERAKTFSFVETCMLPPTPFRSGSLSPSVPQRPVPAPRQFQSITNINIVAHDDCVTFPSIDTSNLEDVQVKKIARKFQPSEDETIKKPSRVLTSSSVQKNNVNNIVSRINALSAVTF